MTFTSCKKEIADDLITDLTVSECKGRTYLPKGSSEEYITIKTVEDVYLLFSHINSIFNCDPGEITVTADITSGTITIEEKESKAGLRCICPYDITFKLGPLEYGNYNIIFQKEGNTFKEYSLDFNESTDVKIDI